MIAIVAGFAERWLAKTVNSPRKQTTRFKHQYSVKNYMSSNMVWMSTATLTLAATTMQDDSE